MFNYLIFIDLLSSIEKDVDIEPKKGRKSRRRINHTPPSSEAPVATPNEQILPPPTIDKVLMAEIENVVHDPYKTTEEIKVG